MDINGQKVKALRQTRGWTQQYLSDACGVSLRTIQRVEKDNAASHDTLAGLCAVFEIAQDSLLPNGDTASGHVRHSGQIHLISAASIGAILGSLVTLFLMG